jgi:hypothetical protein
MKLYFRRASRSFDDAELRRFYQREQIVDLLRKRYRDDQFEENHDLLIFDTSKQHTWLIASDHRLYCVIDNRKENKPKVLWRIRKDELKSRQIRPIEIEDYDSSFGIIRIGGKRIRKYSRSLFNATELKRELFDRLLA